VFFVVRRVLCDQRRVTKCTNLPAGRQGPTKGTKRLRNFKNWATNWLKPIWQLPSLN